MNHAIDTQLIHAGEAGRVEGAVRMPIFQTAMFEHDDGPLRYIRYNNTPNQEVLNRKLAVLEGAEEALVTGSGMTAISGAILSVLKPGEHLLAQNSLYGGTHGFVCTLLADLGITVSFFDANAPDTWQSLLQINTRAIYVESITNPLLRVCDLEGIVAFAQANSLISLIDNTFATPFNYKATAAGFDLSLHSASKYLNGHSDIVAGVIVGSGEQVNKARQTLKHLGGALDPHACFLLYRGMQTLALRMRQHNSTALALAKFLENHDKVSHVYYPGLPSHPQHKRAARLFKGFGGMLSIELKGELDSVIDLIARLNLPLYAPSLGGVESLMTRPAISSHAGLTPEERDIAGIRDSLLRISVGIEHEDDLIADFNQALQ
jgi:cystathionine beta-lyase/cystathionine gamma-synthase